MEPGLLVALIGAPRSGTTWLQRLLASEPRIVSPQETDIFTRYVAPLDEAWNHSLRGGPEAWAQRRFKGLPGLVSEEQFVTSVRAFVQASFDSAFALKPGAQVLVEKSPSHSLHGDLIMRYGPRAKFIHLVRDGRDVAASLVAASMGWGSSWAPDHVRGAARLWREYVEHARDARALGPYLEVRYEALRGGSGGEELRKIFEFCECPVDSGTAAQLLEQNDRARMAATPSPLVFAGETKGLSGVGLEPAGFAAADAAHGWQTWGVTERAAMAAEAGALLLALGYADDDSWVGTAGERRAARSRYNRRRQSGRVLRRVGTVLRRRGERLVDED